jgi:hypothetical protein
VPAEAKEQSPDKRGQAAEAEDKQQSRNNRGQAAEAEDSTECRVTGSYLLVAGSIVGSIPASCYLAPKVNGFISLT